MENGQKATFQKAKTVPEPLQGRLQDLWSCFYFQICLEDLLVSCKHQTLSQKVSKPDKPVGVLWGVHGEFTSQGEAGTS